MNCSHGRRLGRTADLYSHQAILYDIVFSGNAADPGENAALAGKIKSIRSNLVLVGGSWERRSGTRRAPGSSRASDRAD